jgi:hypothetical protein
MTDESDRADRLRCHDRSKPSIPFELIDEEATFAPQKEAV